QRDLRYGLLQLLVRQIHEAHEKVPLPQQEVTLNRAETRLQRRRPEFPHQDPIAMNVNAQHLPMLRTTSTAHLPAVDLDSWMNKRSELTSNSAGTGCRGCSESSRARAAFQCWPTASTASATG